MASPIGFVPHAEFCRAHRSFDTTANERAAGKKTLIQVQLKLAERFVKDLHAKYERDAKDLATIQSDIKELRSSNEYKRSVVERERLFERRSLDQLLSGQDRIKCRISSAVGNSVTLDELKCLRQRVRDAEKELEDYGKTSADSLAAVERSIQETEEADRQSYAQKKRPFDEEMEAKISSRAADINGLKKQVQHFTNIQKQVDKQLDKELLNNLAKEYEPKLDERRRAKQALQNKLDLAQQTFDMNERKRKDLLREKEDTFDRLKRQLEDKKKGASRRLRVSSFGSTLISLPQDEHEESDTSSSNQTSVPARGILRKRPATNEVAPDRANKRVSLVPNSVFEDEED